MSAPTESTIRSFQALRIVESQEKLERAGWYFSIRYHRKAALFSVIASHRDTGRAQSFVREDRSDALAHALQWAELETDAEQPRAGKG